jgi:hypothetical protein
MAMEVPIAKVRLIVLAFLTLASVEPATACHWFSIWHYRTGQHCPVGASHVVAPPPPGLDNHIPLPDLTRWWVATPTTLLERACCCMLAKGRRASEWRKDSARLLAFNYENAFFGFSGTCASS